MSWAVFMEEENLGSSLAIMPEHNTAHSLFQHQHHGSKQLILYDLWHWILIATAYHSVSVYDLYVWNSFSPHFVDYSVSGHEERMAIFPFASCIYLQQYRFPFPRNRTLYLLEGLRSPMVCYICIDSVCWKTCRNPPSYVMGYVFLDFPNETKPLICHWCGHGSGPLGLYPP